VLYVLKPPQNNEKIASFSENLTFVTQKLLLPYAGAGTMLEPARFLK